MNLVPKQASSSNRAIHETILFFAFILGATFYKAERNWLQLSQTSWKLAKESGVDVGLKLGAKPRLGGRVTVPKESSAYTSNPARNILMDVQEQIRRLGNPALGS